MLKAHIKCFEDLPPDVLGTLVLSPIFSLKDLRSLACTCRALRDAVRDDTRCWRQLVERGWGKKTSPRHWIAASMRAAARAPSCCHQDGMSMPTHDFRSLHRVLSLGDSLSGWWKGLDMPKGSLYRLEWGQDCIHALQLHGHTQSTELTVSSLFSLGPAHTLTVAHALDDTHLVVRCYAPPKAAPAAAEAAAAAATLAASPSHSSFPSLRTRARGGVGDPMGAAGTPVPGVAGTSPSSLGGSSSSSSNFAAEVLRFMSRQVQTPRKATRRSQKRANSLGAGSQAATPTVLWGVPSDGGSGPELLLGSAARELPGSAPYASAHLMAGAQQGEAGHNSSSAASTSAGSGSGSGAHADSGGADGDGAGVGAARSRSSALTQELQALQVGAAQHSGRSPSALMGPAIATHHFVRLRPACPSRQHPLLGLWKGVHGPHGLEVIELTTDFKGRHARFLAHKATGDDFVPAGKQSWWASASPMPSEEAASGREVRMQEDRHWLLGSLGEDLGLLPKITSCHKGKGQIAGEGFSNPEWVNGRLWQYEVKGARQSFAFMWMWPGTDDQPMACVTYTRVPE